MNNELNRRAPAQPEPSNKNTGHGHVRPRPDGVRARCGGPGVCKECSREKAAMSQPEPAAPTEATLDQMAGKAWDRFQRHTAELQALENCRLYAARHRKEDWAATILRFCADGGATGSPLREAAPTVVEPSMWGSGDGYWIRAEDKSVRPDKELFNIAFYTTPPRAALGERTTQVLNDLQSALGMMLTFFGMDEDENSESVFDTARQAYQYAQIVLRPIEPHEREALAKLRSTLHQWHESAVAKGFDGVASMLDSVAAAPTVVEPVAWAGYDLDGMVEAFHRVIEAHAYKNNPFHNPIDADAQMALRILRGLVPAMKAYAPTPPRAALTDECLSLLDTAMDSLKYHQEQTRPIHLTQVTIQAIQEFLEKHQIGGPK